MTVKCSRCGTEVSEDEAYSYQGQTLCEDCYIDAISPDRECDPWASYLSAYERKGAGLKGVDGLSEVQKKVYQFIKNSGRATREEIMAQFDLSAADMVPQLKVLMYAELVKEHSEGGTMYLIPIPVDR